jgi:hypothetical protein
MKKENWALGLSGIAIVISIIAICLSYPHKAGLGFDYQGILVSALSLLVTALIGWNIYTIIDIKSTRDKIDEISTGASSMIQKNMAISESANWMIYHYLLLEKDPLGLEYRFLYHGIACLFHTSQFSDIATCNAVVKGLLECIANPKSITITKNRKNEILKLLSGVKHTDKIEGYLELLNKIALVNVK